MNREAPPHDPLPYLETANAAMARAIDTARRVAELAELDVPVLLCGESGTGKHVLAKAIHRWSASRTAPFVTVPGVVLTEHRHEGELFPCTHVTARSDDDEFGSIHAGTLFCEEVGDLPLIQQAKLVRRLDEHRFTDDDRVISGRMRVIAASHRDLEAEVRAGRFRADLFFRLSVVTITLPALRDRPEDLPALTEYLLDNLAQRYQRRAVRLTSEVQEVFRRYQWPKNVRELVNILERALVLSRDDVITIRDLPDRLLTPAASPDSATAPVLKLEEVERTHIHRVIEESSTLEEAAMRLGIAPITLWRKRKRYGLT